MNAVTFRVHYRTQWGENLFLECRLTAPGKREGELQALPMYHEGDGFWSLRLEVAAPGTKLEYRYECRDNNQARRREPVPRQLETGTTDQVVWDHFLAPELPEGAFLRQTFAGVIFTPPDESDESEPALSGRVLRLTLRASRVPAGKRLCVSGGHPLLGAWNPARARVMRGQHYPVWELDLPANEFSAPSEFKFGLWDDKADRLTEWEQGENRWFHGVPRYVPLLVVNYEQYRHAQAWRGAGVALPVFSLRTERGYGVGEFADLALLAKWAARCNLHLVQVLPINDTLSDFSWRDSYPYKAISTAALHPLYINIDAIYSDCGVPLPEAYSERRAALNRLAQIDFETVIKEKLQYLRQLFARVGKAATARHTFKRFLREQEHWLVPYAAFCRLRDLHGTADFNQWGPDAVYRAKEIRAWFKAGAPERDAVMFNCWVQFHLDRQLKQAVAAGHALGVAFKGDLPIGVDRSSVEAWTQSDLFRMDRQTGAPPDAFAVLGQNWGFPTYNWPRMAADGYAWWRRRFQRMAESFDALRIDHILGFFRIWEIPMRYREGLMGHFHPALPLSRKEISKAGFKREPESFLLGKAAESQLPRLFGEATAKVADALLKRDVEGFYRLRPEFETSEARQKWYATALTDTEAAQVEAGLARLGFEVLFLEDPDQPRRFHPRINLADAALFKSLTAPEQSALRRLHDDYFYRRHTDFWANEAMRKLPVLMDASPMLICGEDLGMVPDSVPIVLKRLGLLSLEVQRWPKRAGETLGKPADYPYLSVCTTSTHDMSTIRGWWEEEPTIRQQFWERVMKQAGPAPAACSAEVCRFIVQQNLGANSMWCILLLQDWLGMDPALRHPEAAEERINVPAIPRHYWRYRMHLTLESLLNADGFNREVARMVEASGRRSS